MRCEQCGATIEPGWDFCSKCGRKIDGFACSSCGRQMPGDAQFCYHCGQNKSSSDPPQNPGCEPSVSIKTEPEPNLTPSSVSLPPSAIVMFVITVVIALLFGSWNFFFILFVIAGLVCLYLLSFDDKARLPVVRTLAILITLFGIINLIYGIALLPLATATSDGTVAELAYDYGLVDPLTLYSIAQFFAARSFAQGVLVNSLPIIFFGLILRKQTIIAV